MNVGLQRGEDRMIDSETYGGPAPEAMGYPERGEGVSGVKGLYMGGFRLQG